MCNCPRVWKTVSFVVLNMPFHLLLSQLLGAELLSHRIELEIELNSVGFVRMCVYVFLFLLNVFFDNFQLVYYILITLTTSIL